MCLHLVLNSNFVPAQRCGISSWEVDSCVIKTALLKLIPARNLLCNWVSLWVFTTEAQKHDRQERNYAGTILHTVWLPACFKNSHFWVLSCFLFSPSISRIDLHLFILWTSLSCILYPTCGYILSSESEQQKWNMLKNTKLFISSFKLFSFCTHMCLREGGF